MYNPIGSNANTTKLINPHFGWQLISLGVSNVNRNLTDRLGRSITKISGKAEQLITQK